MKKIKVLHITQSNCGIEEYLKMYFKYMDRDRYEFELICPPYTDMISNITALGVTVYSADMKREISIYHDVRAYIKISNYIKRNKPDIVHTHSSKAGVLGRFAAYANKVPCVYTAHGWSFGMDISENKKKFYAFIERVSSIFTNKIINISDNEQRLALEYNIAGQEKMQVITNGIDIGIYNQHFEKKDTLLKLGIPDNSYIIGMVGRLTRQKSPETFIDIAVKISKKIKNAFFILVGDGELRSEIERLIKIKGVEDRFLITGWTNEVPMYISIFDIALLTSRWEGFGLVLAEYMAAKKPVIASNVGGIPNVIKSCHNGILVEPGDADGFKDAVLELQRNDRLRNFLVNNSSMDVKAKFDFKRVADQHEKLYIQLLKERAGLVPEKEELREKGVGEGAVEEARLQGMRR